MEGGGKQHISRVLFTAAGPGGRAAGVTICLGPPLPAASSGSGGTEREDGQPLFRGPKPWPCSWPGFTEPAPLDAAGALLPHPCTLTCAASGASPASAIGGVFLWHCPHGRPHRALPGRPGHRGARTFLNRPDRSWVETRQRSTDRDHLGCFPGNRLSSRPPAGCPPAREPCWRPVHRWR